MRKKNSFVYDADLKTICHYLIGRLWPPIDEYKKQIESNLDGESNDIPFNILYRKMIKRIEKGKNFVSLILHIDGISLCKSTKLTLWLLSGIFLELPPHLRYRRENMMLISIYIGCNEPVPRFWLASCFVALRQLKHEGTRVRVLTIGTAICERASVSA